METNTAQAAYLLTQAILANPLTWQAPTRLERQAFDAAVNQQLAYLRAKRGL